MALTEEQLRLLGERLVPLYQELEQEVIADIARRVKKTGRYTETAEIMVKSLMEQGYSPAKIQKEVMKLIRADKAYQMEVAKNTKEYKDMVTEEIKKTVEEAKKQGDEVVSRAGMMAYNNDLSMWEKAGKKLSKPNEFTQLINAMALQTNKELKNITRTLGFKGMGFIALENVYQHQLDLGLIKLTSGAYSWQQVVDDCVRGLAQSGLRTIDYKSGRSMQLDTAVRNCILTASSQLAGKVTMLNMEETGETLVEVSSHWGARSDDSCGHADHAYWQGKVYALDKGGHRKESRRLGYAIQSLEEATGYPSDPKGLHGYNCRHTMYPFFEGISEPNKWDPEPKPIRVNGKEYDYYHATQKQRQLERNIRATKREIEAQKAIGGDTVVLNARLKKQLADYKQFSADVNIRPKNERLRVQAGSSNLNKTKAASKKGALAGALNNANDPTFEKRNAFAMKYYESIRNSKSEFIVEKIAQNTGISGNKVSKAVDHLFYKEYNLSEGYGHFDEDYDIAQSIQRLRSGKNIQKHDIILIEHESYEYDLMNKQNLPYDKAHRLAEEKYNYSRALEEFLKGE